MSPAPPPPRPASPVVDPSSIDRTLAELIALLDAYGEERWAMAFGRVREHVSVTIGAADPRSTARVVRDLLHMFRGGLGPFGGLSLMKDGARDDGASERLHRLWTALGDEVGRQLGRGPSS
jgi:hypothetical protein